MNGIHTVANPHDSHSMAAGALESCCICMEDFEGYATADASCVADDESGVANDPLIVVLPCKSHFFHVECISTWIMK